MIWIILILAFAIRIVNLNQSLWWDEGITAWVVKSTDSWQILTGFIKSDFHPPLHYLLLNLWGNIFGFGEISLRLPSVILAVATIFITYLIGKNFFSKKEGMIAAILFTFAPLHIYYSQEARMYSLAAFAVTLSYYFLIKFINKQKYAGVGYVFSIVLVFYSDYMAVFVLVAQALLIVFFYKENISKFFKLVLFWFLLVAPWLPILREQLLYGVSGTNQLAGWKAIIGGANFKEGLLLPIKVLIGRISFDNKVIYGCLVSIVAFVDLIVIIFALKSISKKVVLLLFWIILPPFLAFIVSIWVPIFTYFRFIFILPAFYLLLAIGLNKAGKMTSKILFTTILAFEIIFSSIYFFNPKFQREDWRSAVNFISQKVDKKTLVIFENTEIPVIVKYYTDDLSNFKPGLTDKLEYDLSDKTRVFLFEYLVDIYDPKRMIEQKLKDFRFKETSIYNFSGVGFAREYTK